MTEPDHLPSPSQFLVVTGHALLLETLHTGGRVSSAAMMHSNEPPCMSVLQCNSLAPPGLSCWLSTRLLSHLLRCPLVHLFPTICLLIFTGYSRVDSLYQTLRFESILSRDL